ncbi:protein FAM166A isoform X1 [Numida meleagris]|uniref:protein FAM166A isoform X1 n=1 Tax=Numida meleagris TaxID=8996 RepID=UPI000B3E3960|nr:protein FAM166A isoform X1 [Numida meleagris]
MAAPRQSGLFPPHPHHIPGYEGFVPQYNYQFGETYGKTTYRLLTDPHVRRSPRSVLAPLCKQRFIEDFSGTQHGLQPFLPAQPGYFPYDRAKALTNFPEAEFGPKPPAPGPAEEELAHTDPCYGHGGSGLSRCPPSPAWDPVGRPEGQEWQLPPIPAACGQDRQRGAGTAAGTGQAVRAEGVTPPAAADYRLPRLDVPGVIQQKVIPGYTGYIPRFTWVLGANYLRGVKEAMADFDRQQFLERNPVHSFGKRFPQTYWPDNSIYTSAGLIPAYTGFVPHLRHTYALTFGNSTRKAYQLEQRRRACAL